MKKIIGCLLCILLMHSSYAQQVYNSTGKKYYKQKSNNKGFDRDRLVLGGDFRFFAGTGYVSAGLSPMVGYQIIKNVFAGAKIGYNYDRLKVDPYYLPAGATNNVFNFNAFSSGLWLRYLFLQSIYVHAEIEYNVYDTYLTDNSGLYYKTLFHAPSAMLGIGFRQPVSNRTTINSTILYDMLNDPKSYYSINGNGGFDFRLGILVGF